MAPSCAFPVSLLSSKKMEIRIMRFLALVLLFACPLCAMSCGLSNDEGFRQRVEKVLQTTPLIDGHNDLPYVYTTRVDGRLDALPFTADLTRVQRPTHTDLPRLRQGMMGAQFWSVYIPIRQYPGAPGDTARVLRQIDIVHRLIEKHPHALELALTSDDIRRIHRSGKIASLMGMEGGHAIEDSLAALRMLYLAGARYMTLTHGKGLRWADSATDEERHNGLTAFGKEVVREMNRLGMLVDLSHVSPATMHDALDVTEAPVMFSHSSALGMTAHNRNVPDDVLLRVKDNGGVVMVTFFYTYVNELVRMAYVRMVEAIKAETDDPEEQARLVRERLPELPRPQLDDVADHIDYIRDLIGVDYIGLGGDYDGMPPGPIGLEDVSTYPALFVELMRRGYTDDDIAKIAGENILRVMAETESVSVKLKKERPPSDALIDVLDQPGE